MVTRQSALALVVALAAITLIDTTVLDTINQSLFMPAADYERTRREVGFGGIPMEAVEEALDRHLPLDEAVSLAPSVLNHPLFIQRFPEGLYPRRIDAKAAHQVTVDPAAVGIPLAGSVKLLGPRVEAKLVPRHYSVARDFGRTLILVVSLLGLGMAVLAALRRLRGAGRFLLGLTPSLLPAIAFLVGMLVVTLIASLATWMHFRVRWNALASAGLACAIGVSAGWIVQLVRKAALKTRLRAFGGMALTALRRPEVLLGFALLVFTAYFIDRAPLVLWDTRSIWFFRAKQLFFAGRYLRADAVDYFWAHPGYPLLLPSTLAFFSSFGGWDERRAAMGIAVVLATLSSLVFMLARRVLGRWPGTIFAFIPGFYIFNLLVSGYADGPVTLCLLVAVLGFCDEDTEEIGWLGAFSAALLKREGFVLAFVLCVVHSVIGKSCRRRRVSRRALAFLGFLPPLVHGLWASSLGVADAYAEAKLPAKSTEVWSRASIIWDTIHAQVYLRTPAKIGFAGFVLCLVFARKWRRIPSGAGAAITGVAAVAFTYFVFMVTPYDVRWHLANAFQRLVPHAWFMLTLGGVLLASAKES